MCDPISLTVAAVSTAATVASGNAQSKAIKGAAAQQAQSTSEQVALQREARDNAEKELRPYVDEGNGARRVYNSAFGVAPTGEGDSLEAARSDYDAGFEASPFWRTAQDSTARALQALRSTNAAAGRGTSINSGKALRAASDIAQTYRGGAENSYLTGLGGIADRGFNASGGIASGGQNFANNAASVMAQGAATQGNMALAAANAQAQGWQNAAQIGAYAAGNYLTQPRSYFTPEPRMSSNLMPQYATSWPSLNAVNPLTPRFGGA